MCLVLKAENLQFILFLNTYYTGYFQELVARPLLTFDVSYSFSILHKRLLNKIFVNAPKENV